MRKNCLQPGLLFCWRRSLRQIKRQQFQRYCRLESRIPLKYPVCSFKIHQCLRTLVARLSGIEETNFERNQKRKQRKKLLKGFEGLNLTNPGDNLQIACNYASTKLCIKLHATMRSRDFSRSQSRTSELLRKELRSLRNRI